jgi:hypothetical protein
MDLGIDVDKVTGVLLADGWHVVEDESFTLGGYDFLLRGVAVQRAGDGGVCPVGFEFDERVETESVRGRKRETRKVSGPLTAVLAVRSTA